MSYNTGPIRNIRTVKAIRGESLTIDLGRILEGDLRSWMKKDPNDETYRSFEIRGNRFLYLSKEKASDYYDEEGQLLEAVKGKWYFDLEQIVDPLLPEEVKTVYRGTISFANDITGSVGVEIIDPNLGFNTFIGLNDTPNVWGEPGQMLVVNQSKTALIWIDVVGGVMTEDVTASIDVGGIAIGDIVPDGETMTEFVKTLIAPVVLPTVKSNKSLSASGISTQTLEIGTPFSDTLNYTFGQGVIESKNGAPDTELVGAESTHLFSGAGINTFGVINTPVISGSQYWSILVNHLIGLTPYYDSEGNVANNLDALRIAGNISDNSNIVTGKYRYWFDVGAEGSTPDLSAAIRALVDKGFVGNLTFTIGIPTGDKEISIYIPSSMTLVEVLYIESSNADVTSQFNESAVSVNDAGGNSVSYSKWKQIIGGVGYPAQATYSVTINL